MRKEVEYRILFDLLGYWFGKSESSGGESCWHNKDNKVVQQIEMPNLESREELTNIIKDSFTSVMTQTCFLENLIVAILGNDAQGDGSNEETWLMLTAPTDKLRQAILMTMGKWPDESEAE